MPHLTADALQTDPEGMSLLREVCRGKQKSARQEKVTNLSAARARRETGSKPPVELGEAGELPPRKASLRP
jgi:hypothetical protein